MRRVAQTLAALAILGLLGAGAVVGLGLYDVAARSGHLPGVSWLLHTTYRQSVRRQAPPASEVPGDLDDPDRIALGARHFDAACRTCHSAPGYERTATMRAMVPAPPHVAQAVAGWQPRHLHWIVQEGVKMSGMPHWPSSRKDDVWSVVTFLAAVPGMERAEYDALVAVSDGPDAMPADCALCHGADGRSGNARIPRLDIQDANYLEAALIGYRDGSRESGIMHHAATGAPEARLPDLARYFAGQRPEPVAAASIDPAPVAEGRALAAAGTDDVPASTACHGPEPDEASAAHPRPDGQYARYLETQLRLWRDGSRGGGDRATLMAKSAQDLTEGDIAALAAYYASLPPAGK